MRALLPNERRVPGPPTPAAQLRALADEALQLPAAELAIGREYTAKQLRRFADRIDQGDLTRQATAVVRTAQIYRALLSDEPETAPLAELWGKAEAVMRKAWEERA